MNITELLAISVKNNASDLHLSSGLPPLIRVDGDIRRLNMPSLNHQQVLALIYESMNDRQRVEYDTHMEVDFSFEKEGLARFRVNAFVQNRGASAVFRAIPSNVLSLDEINAPQICKDIIRQPTGIILVTGATGSGKSTTIPARMPRIIRWARVRLVVKTPEARPNAVSLAISSASASDSKLTADRTGPKNSSVRQGASGAAEQSRMVGGK